MIVKRGKREQRGMTPAQTRKRMKRTLLYTYFTTLASLVLCCVMFLGTTMAWFTSDVTNTGNVIQVGTLSAALYHVEPVAAVGEESETLSNETLLNENPQHPVFDLNTKWAPRTVQTQVLKVVNKGDLNFNYELSLLLAGTTLTGVEDPTLAAEQQMLLLDSFEVYVYPGQTTTLPGAEPTSDGEASVSWVRLGTLSSFLPAAQSVETAEGAEGTVVETSTEVVYEEIPLYSGTLEPNVTLVDGAATDGSVQYITVAIKMVDTPDTSLMGQSLTINVKLAATQTIADGND